MHRIAPEGHRVLISAPFGCDAASVASVLREQGYDAVAYEDVAQLAASLDDHAGVILVTEEALAADLSPLGAALELQPSWSDIPFVLLTSRRRSGQDRSTQAARRRLPENAANVVMLERPLSTESLTSAIASAMRARQKQFLIRDQVTALEVERKRLSTLVEHLPVGVAFVSPSGNVELSNPAFRRFSPSGQSPAFDVEAQPRWGSYAADASRLAPNDFPGVRSLRGETVAGVEFLYHSPDDVKIWTRVTGVPLHDEQGAITGAIAVIVDIDEQKRAQEALGEAARNLEADVAARTAELEDALEKLKVEAADRERAEAALRQSQKMEAVGQLTGGIAHDFNNMLTGVIGAIDIMKRRIASNRYDDLDRFMDVAATSAQRAAGLTARLLAFSRRQSLDSRALDVAQRIATLEELLRRTMTEKIEVSIVTAGCPPAVVDANQLENAVLNLAINARDAMPDGGKLTIETRLTDLDDAYVASHPGVAPGRYVVVAVSDTGVGMDQDTIDKVFDPFFTTKPIGQGTGLGLSMVYGFAKQSNGQVRVHSTLNVGTTVSLFLPVAEDAIEDAKGREVTDIHEGNGQLVLLVEDDDSVRLLVRDVLEELGYRTVEAAEAEKATELLRSGRCFDLMVSDVGLPGMNGRQLAEVAREYHPDLPILFVTGYAENAAHRAGFLGSGMAMITKPFQIEVLSAKVREMLGSS